jgi:hypothetical protein
LNDFRRTLTMKDDWGSAFLTAFLLAGPSILGVRALFRGPTRFAGRVVPRAMDRLAAAVWLAAFALTIAIVFYRKSYNAQRGRLPLGRLGTRGSASGEYCLSRHWWNNRTIDGEAGGEAQSQSERQKQSSLQEPEAMMSKAAFAVRLESYREILEDRAAVFESGDSHCRVLTAPQRRKPLIGNGCAERGCLFDMPAMAESSSWAAMAFSSTPARRAFVGRSTRQNPGWPARRSSIWCD